MRACEAPAAEATGTTGSAQLPKTTGSAPARQIDARASPAPIVAAAPAQAFIFVFVIIIKIHSESHCEQHASTISDSICPEATVVPAASTATAPQAHAEFKIGDIKAKDKYHLDLLGQVVRTDSLSAEARERHSACQ